MDNKVTNKINYFHPIPYALTAVALGLTTLGTAWSLFKGSAPGIHFQADWVKYLTFAFALIFFILPLSKAIGDYRGFYKEMKSGTVSSHLPVLFMATMAIGEFCMNESVGASGQGAYYIGIILWYIGLILQLSFLGWWIVTRIMWFDIKEVDAAWYVPAVGIPVACAIEPKVIGLGYTPLLQGLWYLSFVFFLGLTVLIVYRYLFINPIHTVEMPAFGIMAAPASLLLVTYFFAFGGTPQERPEFMWFLGAVAISLTLITYISMIKIFQSKFNPGFAAFSFPLAIGIIARMVFVGWLSANYGGINPELVAFFRIEAFIELMISSIVMVYLIVMFGLWVISRYLKFQKGTSAEYVINDNPPAEEEWVV